MRIKIAPSILSANFAFLQEDIDKIKNADFLHIDVMDGHFVPNITIGPVVVEKVKTNLVKDVHLMIENPEKYIGSFRKAGADIIVVHADTCKNLKKTIADIKALGAKAGVAINPDKPLSLIEPVLDDVDMVLLMTVYAGFGGQTFIEDVLPKIEEIRSKYHGDIQVDGGINDETIKKAVCAGANVIVAGSYVFNHPNPGEAVDILRKAAEEALK